MNPMANCSQGPSFKSVDKECYNQLRRPNIAGKEFILSPNAPEFVPQKKQFNNINNSSTTTTTTTNTLSDGLKNLNINPTAAATVVQHQQQQQIRSHHQPHFDAHNNHNHLNNYSNHQLQQQQQHLSQQYQQPQQNSISTSHYDQYHYQNPQASTAINNNYAKLTSSASTMQTAVKSNLNNRLTQAHVFSHNNIQSSHQQQNSSSRYNQPSINPQQNRFKNSYQYEQQQQQQQQFQPQTQENQKQYINNHYQQPQTSSDSDSTTRSNQDSSYSSESSEGETFAINYITEIMEFLNRMPGSFDSVAPRVLNVLRDYIENEYVMSNIMEIIFIQSIEEQNFRYMGAKLYNLLDSINPKENSTFRNLLNYKLNYNREEVEVYMQNENSKVRGTTLFLAEIYMQLRNNCPTPEIAQNIIYTIKQLLKKESPENVKCICLTLKLSGYYLETDCPNDLKDIINNLTGLKMDVSTSRLLENILTLNKNNWGRKKEVIINQPQPQQQFNYINDSTREYRNDPIYYSPDGKVLCDEELSFFESQCLNDQNKDENTDFDDVCDLVDPTGMDAALDDDYDDDLEEFLKIKNQNHSC